MYKLIVNLSRILSYCFHPILMPLLGIFLIFSSGIYDFKSIYNYSRFVYLVVLLCYIILPLCIVSALLFYKQMQNITLNQRNERITPLFFTAICFYLGYLIVTRASDNYVTDRFLLSSVAIMILILIISAFWKISIHMAGIGGLTSLVLYLSWAFRIDMLTVFLILIFLSGIIASARLILKSHNWLQIVTGYILGFIVVLLSLIFPKQII